jgi:hypothetical protein
MESAAGAAWVCTGNRPASPFPKCSPPLSFRTARRKRASPTGPGEHRRQCPSMVQPAGHRAPRTAFLMKSVFKNKIGSRGMPHGSEGRAGLPSNRETPYDSMQIAGTAHAVNSSDRASHVGAGSTLASPGRPLRTTHNQ